MKRIAFLLFALMSFNAFGMTGDERRRVTENVAQLLESRYVIPEKGSRLAAQVRAASYDAATTESELAGALNQILATANDRHLRVRSASDPQRVMRRRPSSGGSSIVRSAEVLEGNIGYIDIGGFAGGEEALSALSAAMATLANTDAMIIDVRKCPGGSADTVSYLASYFFDDEKRVLMKRYNRPSNTSFESTTVAVPGKRMPNVDLYILTGPNSASACESFAFSLQQWGRAKTIGEKTAGAGYNNEIADLGFGLSLSISVGTAIHPKTNKQFEAVGVQPDLSVPADQALDVATKTILPSRPERAH